MRSVTENKKAKLALAIIENIELTLPTIAVARFLLNDPSNSFTKGEIAQNVHLCKSKVSRALKSLGEINVVSEIKVVDGQNRFKLRI